MVQCSAGVLSRLEKIGHKQVPAKFFQKTKQKKEVKKYLKEELEEL